MLATVRYVTLLKQELFLVELPTASAARSPLFHLGICVKNAASHTLPGLARGPELLASPCSQIQGARTFDPSSHSFRDLKRTLRLCQGAGKMAPVVRAAACKPANPGSILRTCMVELLKAVTSTRPGAHTAPPPSVSNKCHF